MGDPFVALDAVGAGVGERVLAIQEGFSAMTAVGHTEAPIDAAVIGVVDQRGARVIARLRGKLAEKEPARVVIDVTAWVTKCSSPPRPLPRCRMPAAEVSLDIHTHVREDALALYGFSSRQERRVFERLITISGIGPRLAVTILSGGSVEGLVGAIRRGDLARLTSIPGVGKKTAERIVVELRDKLQEFTEEAAKACRRNRRAVGARESRLFAARGGGRSAACRER